MITIFRNSWHYKLYSFYMGRFNDEYRTPENINLCPYMRTIILWLPLQYAYRVFLIAIVELLILINTAGFVSVFQVLKALGIMLGIAAAIGGLGMLAAWLFTREKKEPTTLLGTWFKAKHDKICPVLRVL